jgi:ATP-dependent helicase/nuclease subunit B
MGALAAMEISAWLREGGFVVTASDRAARALLAAFHRARQAEGLTAWPTPKILDWNRFIREAWDERSTDARLLLNSTQEQALWMDIAGQNRSLATLLEASRHRLAKLAMEAHELLCSHAPQFLHLSARAGWQQDAAAFSSWLAAFDESCHSNTLLSPSRLPLELIPLLESETAKRPPLLLAGFDRILPVQRKLFDAWGEWRETAKNASAAKVHFHAAVDAQTELAACAIWCKRQLAVTPKARLLVVVQAASARRGEIERAFLEHTGPVFEFSLGIPLGQVALARAALLLLRWLNGPLDEQELDWLLSTGHIAADAKESAALVSYLRTLRRRNLERPQWTLKAFLSPHCATELLPAPWVERILTAQRCLLEFTHHMQSPLSWAELIPQLLDKLHFASARPLESTEYQALHRWQLALESCGSLGFDGRRIGWKDFLSELSRNLDETLFAPESHDAPIQIAGPAESAGLSANAIWFLGTDEGNWPASGMTHPLLPIEIQREAGMPHATPQLDWDLAATITKRLLATAPEVHFSYARQDESAEARPSRLIAQLAGVAEELTPELTAPSAPKPLTEEFQDSSRIPFPPGKVAGGAKVLTAQSQCPFQAFATARLAAQDWKPAEAGLTPMQRGNLLHAVLQSIWAGAPDGIRTHAELVEMRDRQVFVAKHVERVFAQELPFHLRERMPRRYLQLEEERLIELVTKWLEYESARVTFEVIETEVKRTVHLDGLTFDLRLDRLDRCNDGTLLVIDYKSGDVSPNDWNPPRPKDVQLPLYAGFALETDEELGGLVFAKVRPGELTFAGRVGDAAHTLFAGVKTGPLARTPLTGEQLLDWKDCIEQLAKDFLSGKAEVDPREAPKTCERCGLQVLCRIQEHQPQLEDDGEEANDE